MVIAMTRNMMLFSENHWSFKASYLWNFCGWIYLTISKENERHTGQFNNICVKWISYHSFTFHRQGCTLSPFKMEIKLSIVAICSTEGNDTRLKLTLWSTLVQLIIYTKLGEGWSWETTRQINQWIIYTRKIDISISVILSLCSTL